MITRRTRGRRPSGHREYRSVLVVISLALSAALISSAQASSRNADTSVPPENELHIARLIYQHHAYSSWGPGRPWWSIDWPEAEEHFTDGVTRYTNIQIAPDSRHIVPTDNALFDYPWLFVQQVGRWSLSKDEKKQLREYLQRGGFMVVDDFHGPAQWDVFLDVIRDIVGDREIVDIAPSDQLMNVLYTLDLSIQIPGRRHLHANSGGQSIVNMPHSPSHFRGIYDDDGRLMVVINFNMDMGDAWEHADDPVYPVPMTATAYRFGINYVIYAMTH